MERIQQLLDDDLDFNVIFAGDTSDQVGQIHPFFLKKEINCRLTLCATFNAGGIL